MEENFEGTQVFQEARLSAMGAGASRRRVLSELVPPTRSSSHFGIYQCLQLWLPQGCSAGSGKTTTYAVACRIPDGEICTARRPPERAGEARGVVPTQAEHPGAAQSAVSQTLATSPKFGPAWLELCSPQAECFSGLSHHPGFHYLIDMPHNITQEEVHWRRRQNPRWPNLFIPPKARQSTRTA